MTRKFAPNVVGWSVLVLVAVPGPAHSQCPLGQLEESVQGGLPRFGWSVSIDGDTAVVGVPGEDTLANDAGSAFVLHYDAEQSEWVTVQQLFASNPRFSDQFGWSVSIDGDVIAIGAPHPFSFSFPGQVYLFRQRDGIWEEEQVLLSPQSGADDRFGKALSVHNQRLLVGAGEPQGPGAAYLFEYSAVLEEWTLRSALIPPGLNEEDGYGNALCLRGNLAVIGAPQRDTSGVNSGSVFTFEYQGHWVLEEELSPIGTTAGDAFGSAVSVDRGRLVVGSPKDANFSGRARVFRYSIQTSSWEFEDTLKASDEEAGDHFGTTVALSLDAIVIGVPGDGIGGAAYVFRDSGERWFEEVKLAEPNPVFGNGFGVAVASDGAITLVGAPLSGASDGRVYPFVIGAGDCNAPLCGDGMLVDDEECDDGNNWDGDGCFGCVVEPGFVCASIPATDCIEVCDGSYVPVNEECGWNCPGPSECETVCGDAIIVGFEECDDGNEMGGDGCAHDCTIEAGYVCSGQPSVCLKAIAVPALSSPGVLVLVVCLLLGVVYSWGRRSLHHV